MDTNETLLKPQHPEADSARTMGIVSVVCLVLMFSCIITGIIGIVLGFIALKKAKLVKNDFAMDPMKYNPEGLQKADLARTLGLISVIAGLVFNGGLVLLFLIMIIVQLLTTYS